MEELLKPLAHPDGATQHNLQPCQRAALLTGSGSEAQRKQTNSDCENSAVGPSWCPLLISHKASFVLAVGASLLALNRPTRWRLPGPSFSRPSPPLPQSLSVSALMRIARPPLRPLCIFWKGSIRKLIHRPVGKSSSLTVGDAWVPNHEILFHLQKDLYLYLKNYLFVHHHLGLV